MKRQLTSQDLAAWVPSLGVVAALWLATSWRFRLYRPPHHVGPWTILAWSAKHSLAISSITILSVFFSRQIGEGASRLFVFCMLPVSFVVFAMTRWIAMLIMQDWKPPRIALIGDSASAKQLLSRVEYRIASAIRGVIIPETAAAVAVGHFAPVLGSAAPMMEAGPKDGLPVLGTIGQIAELVNREQIERVIVLNGSLSDSEVERCNKVFWRMGLPVSHTLDFALSPNPVQFRRSLHRVDLSRHNGLSIVEVRPAPLILTQDFLKHALDFGLALTLLAFLWPALLVIGIAVKLTSRGPALERPSLVGKGGRHFTCFKFRTTYREDDPALLGATTTKRGIFDQAAYITPIGAFLRRFSLDELPQLINILLGDMSFVGPRPLPAQDFDPDGMSREFFDWSEARARVRPGLTGLWQVSGRRNLSFDEMINLDIEYIQTRSLWRDVLILLKTPVPVFRGIGAR